MSFLLYSVDYDFLLPLFVLTLKLSRCGQQKPIQAVSGVLQTCPRHFLSILLLLKDCNVASAVHLSFCIFSGASLRQVSRSGISGSKGKCMCNFARQCHIPLSSVCLHQQRVRVPTASYRLTSRVIAKLNFFFTNLEGRK